MHALDIGTSLVWRLEVGHPDQDFGPFAPRAAAQEILKIAWNRRTLLSVSTEDFLV